MINHRFIAFIVGAFLSVACSSKDPLLRERDGAADQPGPVGGTAVPRTGTGGSIVPGSPDAPAGTGGSSGMVTATTAVGTGGAGGSLPMTGTGGTTLPPAGTGGTDGGPVVTSTGGTTFPNPTARGGAGGTTVLTGTGGTGGTISTTTSTAIVSKPVGQTVTGVTKLILAVNLADGAVMTVRRDETWTLEVGSGATSYVDTAGTKLQATATTGQIQAIADALAAAEWHTNAGCFFCCTDGPPYSPKITVTSAAGDWALGVSDKSCTPSSRGYVGDVIRCSDYGKLLAAFEAVIAGVSTGACESAW